MFLFLLNFGSKLFKISVFLDLTQGIEKTWLFSSGQGRPPTWTQKATALTTENLFSRSKHEKDKLIGRVTTA